MVELSDAKRRVVDRLKRAETLTAAELAHEFELTDTAIRQHLESLERSGLVSRTETHTDTPGRGRPPVHWRLTPHADALYTDRHVDLTVELIDMVRETLGEVALQQVIHARAGRQTDEYRTALIPYAGLEARVRRLAQIRTAEGYLAEATNEGETLTLVEHHCPIRQAARSCDSLCGAELEVFRGALGPGATIEREQHLLAGAQRCTYRITPIVETEAESVQH